MTTLNKLDENTLEVRSESKIVVDKQTLLKRKAELEKELTEVNSWLDELK